MQRRKIALIGEVSAGKTTMANYISQDKFIESRASTIGAAFHILKSNGKNFELWDTSGQEQFSKLTSLYYRNANILILVFDASNNNFANKLKFYLDETKLQVDEGNDYQVIIVCNKIDLVDKSKLITLKKQVEEIINNSLSKNHVTEYIETSSKNRIGRDLLIEKFHSITEEQNKKKQQIEAEYSIFKNRKDDIINLEDYEDKGGIKGCCF